MHRCGSPQWSSQTSNPENTRPISLLPMMSKVCERAANTQFMDFLDKSKISGLQSGNINFYSTETTRLHYTGQLLQNTDENEYLLLYYLTCLKLSTASNGKTYYRRCTYWVCLTPLWPGLRATYHYASKWSGSAVSYPIPPTDRCGIGVHSRSSFVHVVRQQPPLCSEEVRSRGLCKRHQAAMTSIAYHN